MNADPMNAWLRHGLALLLALVSLAGCSSSETHDKVERPVRFAVVAAPELGQDDGDLLSAVTRLSRENELAFVLVLGPLFAPDADATTLDLFKNDLGQVAAPIYVSFAGAAPVTSDTPAQKLKSDEILAAVESMGPGSAHKLSYVARPDRAKAFAVNALAPTGAGAIETLPADTRRIVRFGVVATEPDGPKALRADVLVSVASGAEVELVGARPDQPRAPSAPVLVRVPPLSRKLFAIVALSDQSVAVTPVALEGSSPTPPPPVPAPLIDRKAPE